MGILAKLFGSVGTVRFECITTDGEKLIWTAPIEAFNVSIEQIEKYIANVLYVQKGIISKSLHIIGYSRS